MFYIIYVLSDFIPWLKSIENRVYFMSKNCFWIISLYNMLDIWWVGAEDMRSYVNVNTYRKRGYKRVYEGILHHDLRESIIYLISSE